MKGIGNLVKELRLSSGIELSQKELADKAGLNVETVNRIEHDQNTAIDSLYKIANALGVTIGDLLPEEQYPQEFKKAHNKGTSQCNDREHEKYHKLLEEILHSEKDELIQCITVNLKSLSANASDRPYRRVLTAEELQDPAAGFDRDFSFKRSSKG
ncbi:MAG: helix-turn-helix transcriptional regulator [Acidobacteria bacterium]|nr:helix-turn-helix transcriptional regulator [Acidobacteriota bacterium]